jgi:hypothetical protein
VPGADLQIEVQRVYDVDHASDVVKAAIADYASLTGEPDRRA